MPAHVTAPDADDLAVEFVDPVAFVGAPEVALLVALLRKSIVKSAQIGAIPDNLDWEGFLHIAQESRVLLIAAHELHASGLQAPSDVLKTIERYRALTLSLNGSNLVTLRAIIKALTTAGIEVINLKGPVALSELHGDRFIRPSTDIDLLVRSADFPRAGEIIRAAGFMAPRGADTIWWRTFLGEQHYYREGAPPIDLHHRIQQPGCPAPRSMQAFWENRSHASVGTLKVPVLSPSYACLLSCVGLAKAIANREPAGAHAYDVAAYIAPRSRSEVKLLVDIATGLGLLKTLHLGLRVARALFGISVLGAAVDRAMGFATDADIATLVMAPDKARVAISHRTRLLASLVDSPADLARNLAWAAAARAARLTTPQRTVVERQWTAQLAARR